MEPYLFDLENPIEDVSQVPEDLHGFFEQGESGYVVRQDYVPLAKRMNGLATNLQTERSKRTQAGKDAGKAREMAKAFQSVFEGVEGIDEVTPDNVRSVFEDLQARAAKGGEAGEEAKKQIEAVKSQMASAHAKDLSVRDEKLAEKDRQIEALVRGSQVTDAIAKHEVIGGDVFKSFLESRVQVQAGDDGLPKAVVTDEQGNPIYNGAGDPMSVDEFVASLRSKDEYAPFFKSQRKPGDGGGPSAPQGQRQNSGGEGRPAHEKIGAGLQQLHNRRR